MELPINEIISTVRKTRDITLTNYGNVEVADYKDGSPASAVTEMDQQVEHVIKAGLAQLLPDIPFVGEEFGGDREGATFWLCDPIDGTGHFIRGMPFCTTMLALIHNNEVVFGLIYDFVNDDIYYAERGKGAFKNDERISISDRDLQKSYLFYEFRPTETGKRIHDALDAKAIILQTVSCGFQFIQVASGKAEGFIVYDGYGKDYDFAAGTLLVKEAGGVVCNFKSGHYDYRNLSFIAANPPVYDELIKSEESIEKLMDQ